ncbi:molybdenum cofactor synthesis domain protein [Burkholderiales bacterium JOSHI_001]|nr:molybdenum cofactor synthesis domain protein [Burkholderiales bacterium JOSHI_001]
MSQRAPMITLDEAMARLADGALSHRIQQTETIASFDALGRVLAAPVVSPLFVPPEDNSSMDGYALRAADVPAAGTVLPVSQRIPAGHPGQPLAPGSAARIFTGAQVPAAADAIVMQEQCEAVPGEGLGSVRVDVLPQAGHWIRRRGEDVMAGSVVLNAGARLTPQALGLVATVGAAQVQVLRRPRVALFSTGDELVMPGQPLPPGAIYNSNRYTLRALLQAAGCEVTDLGIVPDTLEATRDTLRRAAAGNDLILTSGGVSVGEEDHIRPAVTAEGEVQMWQVAMKPGKPLAFGRVGTAAFMGLPGNPVSSFITFLLAVAPVLRVMQGMPAGLPAALHLRAAFAWPKPDKRREFMRARLNALGELELFPNQSSGVMTSAVWADGLVDNPASQAVTPGDTVRFLPLSELIHR